MESESKKPPNKTPNPRSERGGIVPDYFTTYYSLAPPCGTIPLSTVML